MVTPTLRIRGSAAAIEFYCNAFNAVEIMRMEGPNGTIAQAEIKLGDAPVESLVDQAKLSVSTPPRTIALPVADRDAALANALAAGARQMPDKVSVEDPFGHVWRLVTRG